MVKKTYTTIQGDMWDSIALKTLGSEYKMNELIDANLKHREIVIFPAGIILEIPEIKETIISNLPPWMKLGDGL